MNESTSLSVVIGLVVYNPSPNEQQIIAKLIDSRFPLLIVDNSIKLTSSIESNLSHNELWVLSRDTNIGLSKAYNLFLSRAKELNYKYVLLLDQDSDFDTAGIPVMLQGFRQVDNQQKVGQICPAVSYLHESGRVACNIKGFKPVDWAISSGSLVDVDIGLSIGGFDDFYFIDRVDADFCWLLKKQSFSTLICNEVTMPHCLGTLGRFGSYQHSAIRHYYRSRNRVYFNFKHFGYLKAFSFSLVGAVKQVVIIIIYEDKAWSKLKYLVRGVMDSIKKTSGGKYY